MKVFEAEAAAERQRGEDQGENLFEGDAGARACERWGGDMAAGPWSTKDAMTHHDNDGKDEDAGRRAEVSAGNVIGRIAPGGNNKEGHKMPVSDPWRGQRGQRANGTGGADAPAAARLLASGGAHAGCV